MTHTIMSGAVMFLGTCLTFAGAVGYYTRDDVHMTPVEGLILGLILMATARIMLLEKPTT